MSNRIAGPNKDLLEIVRCLMRDWTTNEVFAACSSVRWSIRPLSGLSSALEWRRSSSASTLSFVALRSLLLFVLAVALAERPCEDLSC